MEAAVLNVLNNDDLLIEILLRIAFPTALVRAALVCKRWFHHVSDGEFLLCFRKLHPPCLLGYYCGGRFVPMLPQPPELASVVRRVASYSLGGASVQDCRNGSVYTILSKQGSEVVTVGVHSLLCPDRAMAVVPPLPRPRYVTFASGIISNEEGGLLYMDVSVAFSSETTHFTVYMLQEGVWRMHASATIQLHTFSGLQAVLVDNKIYLMGTMRHIIVLDLITSSISTLQLPQGVDCASSEIKLSPADDASGVYLIHVELQLRIWLRRRDGWLLVDTISFGEMVANLRMSDCTMDDEHTADVQINQVGDDAAFVFLKIGQYTLYLDIKCRTLRKVHKRTEQDLSLERIYPFMMIWPPTFPTLQDDLARNGK